MTQADRKELRLIVAVTLATVLMAMQQTMVIPLLPTVASQFNSSLGGASWAVAAFLLAASVATPVLAKVGDSKGRKAVAVSALAVQVAGTVATALAPTLAVFIAGRAASGVGAALFPLAIGLVRHHVGKRRAHAGIAALSSAMGAGAGFGLLLPGIVALFDPGFRAALVVASVLAGAAATLVIIGAPRDHGEQQKAPIDVLGAGLLAVAVVAVLLALQRSAVTSFLAPSSLALVAVFVLSAVGWVLWELRTQAPLVDLRLVLTGSARIANVAALLLGFGMFAFFTTVSAYAAAPPDVGYGVAATTLQVGLFLLPSGAAMVLLVPVSARLIRSAGAAATCTVGSLIVAASFVVLIVAPGTATTIAAASVTFGIGLGIGYGALGALAIEGIPVAATSMVSATNGLARTLGGSISGAVVTSILAAHTSNGGDILPDGFLVTFEALAAACCVAAGVTLSAVISRRKRLAT